MLGRWLITILIFFQSIHLHAFSPKATTPDNPTTAQETEEEKKKKNKKDDEEITSYASLMLLSGTFWTFAGIQGVIAFFRENEFEKKLDISNQLKNIEILKNRFATFTREHPDAPYSKIIKINEQLTQIENNLNKRPTKNKENNKLSQNHTKLLTELKKHLDDLNLDIEKVNEYKAKHQKIPTFNLEISKPTLKNSHFNFPKIILDHHNDPVPEKTKKEVIDRVKIPQTINLTCSMALKNLITAKKAEKAKYPYEYKKWGPATLFATSGAITSIYVWNGTRQNNINDLSAAKKLLDKKQDLETTQKATLENLIKEDSKKTDTILEPFITYSSDILSSHQEAIKESLLKNFKFLANSAIIKEKIDEEFKNFKNPAILRTAILKALSISGDNSKVFTIDELEKKMYGQNPLEATTEHPKFLRRFYSEAIRQLYPLTMADEKKEYISADIYNELVDKTQKRLEESKSTRKQLPK